MRRCLEKRKQYLGCVRSLFPVRGKAEMLDLSSPFRTCWSVPVGGGRNGERRGWGRKGRYVSGQEEERVGGGRYHGLIKVYS